ncbi:hypothetical protein MMC08_006753 [Hypocenomyce scalaris]|nr:hypothetical protein [Hypocenomyce scalaris]
MTADKVASYGRGGAGNIGVKNDNPPPDLVTPTIKTEMYSTGRGGQGNMSKNNPDEPQLARESQDVNGAPRRYSEGESFFGRGGAANTTRPSPEEVAKAKEENRRIEQQARQRSKERGQPRDRVQSRDRIKGLADKGKDMLKMENKIEEK